MSQGMTLVGEPHEQNTFHTRFLLLRNPDVHVWAIPLVEALWI